MFKTEFNIEVNLNENLGKASHYGQSRAQELSYGRKGQNDGRPTGREQGKPQKEEIKQDDTTTNTHITQAVKKDSSLVQRQHTQHYAI